MSVTWKWAPVAWLGGYAALRVWWAASGLPGGLSGRFGDLVVFTGWGAAGLCLAALVTAVAVASSDPAGAPRPALLGAGWAASAALAAAAAMLLLDAVGAIFPGLGLDFSFAEALNRAACALGGVLLGRATLTAQRRWGGGPASALDRTPAWAYAAAHGAVVGCLVRILAQAVVGFGSSPLDMASALAFEAAFLLAGTLLPLALVHRWGRIWPRWVPFLRGRAVPRRLVLWPATGVASGIVVYFGLMLLQMVWERQHGRNPFPAGNGLDLPETFFWVAVPAYFAWGVGLAFAAVADDRGTRPGSGQQAPLQPADPETQARQPHH
ncbi:hypothetical protein [Actinocorallia longicatena]|uniref:Uncharacterized protein n=1 Tax=Actinocorallia longicatena TaxID=111803 RepID=A0ABP6QH17_9ACTN